MIVCSKIRNGDKREVKVVEGKAAKKHVFIVDDLVCFILNRLFLFVILLTFSTTTNNKQHHHHLGYVWRDFN